MAKRNALGEIKKGKKEFITIRKLLNDLAGRIVPGPNFWSTQLLCAGCIRLAVFLPKDAIKSRGIHKKNCSHAFLTLRGRGPLLMASPLVNMFTKMLFSSKAVEQGEYPEITMDGFKYAEKVTYATWLFPKASVSGWGNGSVYTSPDKTQGHSDSVFLPTAPQPKKHSVFLFFPSDSMMQLLNWSLGKKISS